MKKDKLWLKVESKCQFQRVLLNHYFSNKIRVRGSLISQLVGSFKKTDFKYNFYIICGKKLQKKIKSRNIFPRSSAVAEVPLFF